MTTYAASPTFVRAPRARTIAPSFPLVKRAWATACAYVIVYAVAFAFLMGPAGNYVANSAQVGAARASQFAMVLVSLAIMAIASLALSFVLAPAVDAEAVRRRWSRAQADVVFGAWSVVVALGAAALFAGIATVAFGGYHAGIGWAALVGILVPAVVAGLTARGVASQLAAKARSLVTASVGALAAVGIAVYVCAGILDGGFMAAAPSVF